MKKAIIKKEKQLPDKQRRHPRRYKSCKVTIVNPDNKVRMKHLPSQAKSKLPGIQQRRAIQPKKITLSPKIAPRTEEQLKKIYADYIKHSPDVILGGIKDKIYDSEFAAMQACPMCGQPAGDKIFISKDGVPLQGRPVTAQFCEDCFTKYLLDKGVAFFAVPDDKPWDGPFIILKQEAFKEMFKEHPNRDRWLKSRTVFMLPEQFFKTFGKQIKLQKKEQEKPKSLKELMEDLKELQKKSRQADRQFKKIMKELYNV